MGREDLGWLVAKSVDNDSSVCYACCVVKRQAKGVYPVTQGIFVKGRRPATKKQIKEQVAEDPSRVSLEATSMFGNEYDGPVTEAPDGTYTFVGPDPYNKRTFYGNIKKAGETIRVT